MLQRIKLPRFLGRRGASLIFFAFLYGIFAWSFLVHPELSPRVAALTVIEGILPIRWWGPIWAAACVICVVAAFWRLAQATAFGLGALLWATWGAGYFGAVLIGAVPWAQGTLGAAVYFALGLLMVVIAGWQENRNSQ